MQRQQLKPGVHKKTEADTELKATIMGPDVAKFNACSESHAPLQHGDGHQAAHLRQNQRRGSRLPKKNPSINFFAFDCRNDVEETVDADGGSGPVLGEQVAYLSVQEGTHDMKAVVTQPQGVLLEKIQQFCAFVVGARHEHLGMRRVRWDTLLRASPSLLS